MARSGHCKTCGATIRPRAKDMSVAAASRLHYWKHHREKMLGTKRKSRSSKSSRSKRRQATTKARR